jgi:hypothetical protein
VVHLVKCPAAPAAEPPAARGKASNLREGRS